ncbi:hypothetical protein [Crithidia abscondita leishbunyavirus]|uniref:Uncharacterized protein n=1 Tax=Crithidia abscondita leishbunyavirus TaxID=1888351 RepID=A0A2R2Q2M2_9VIRU|nr:hypothetical protein [Crithidia abscondita leishbunyavirus]
MARMLKFCAIVLLFIGPFCLAYGAELAKVDGCIQYSEESAPNNNCGKGNSLLTWSSWFAISTALADTAWTLYGLLLKQMAGQAISVSEQLERQIRNLSEANRKALMQQIENSVQSFMSQLTRDEYGMITRGCSSADATKMFMWYQSRVGTIVNYALHGATVAGAIATVASEISTNSKKCYYDDRTYTVADCIVDDSEIRFTKYFSGFQHVNKTHLVLRSGENAKAWCCDFYKCWDGSWSPGKIDRRTLNCIVYVYWPQDSSETMAVRGYRYINHLNGWAPYPVSDVCANKIIAQPDAVFCDRGKALMIANNSEGFAE